MNKKMQLYNRLHKLNTAQIITLGFAGVIILGGLLLWLPFCTAPGYHTSFTDAMFTATTSICVTGLVTHSELNAILNYRGGSLEGAKLYVSLFPCNECAKAIIQAGIKTIVYDCDKYADTPAVIASKRMLDAAGVRYYKYNRTGRKITIEV